MNRFSDVNHPFLFEFGIIFEPFHVQGRRMRYNVNRFSLDLLIVEHEFREILLREEELCGRFAYEYEDVVVNEIDFASEPSLSAYLRRGIVPLMFRFPRIAVADGRDVEDVGIVERSFGNEIPFISKSPAAYVVERTPCVVNVNGRGLAYLEDLRAGVAHADRPGFEAEKILTFPAFMQF